MAKNNPAEFVRQVRQEVSKVEWPTKREAMLTTFMVFLLSGFMALFFVGVDKVLSFGIKLILGN